MGMPGRILLLVVFVLTLCARSASANLVTNGGFEAGDLTGWTVSGASGLIGVDTANPHSGSYAAYMGPVGSNGYLSQSLSTAPGTEYLLDFWLREDNQTPNFFGVTWGGSSIFSQPDLTLLQPSYVQYQFTVYATGTATTLTFATQNDSGYFYLDDVSVNEVPVPGSFLLVSSGFVGMLGMGRGFSARARTLRYRVRKRTNF